MSRYHIILVDDDQNITTSLRMSLEAEGFSVDIFHDGESGYNGLQKNTPDVAILDIKMPRMDGLELLQKLRDQKKSFPIIMLTSKDDEVDELMGFRLGADDYIKKPFSQRLLIARIYALLKRKREGLPVEAANSETKENVLERGSLRLDDIRHLCIWKGQPVNLTVTEYLLLQALALHPGHVKNRNQLIDYAYGENIFIDDRTIDSHIKRIRKKFHRVDPEFNYIETLYGVGYKYIDDSV